MISLGFAVFPESSVGWVYGIVCFTGFFCRWKCPNKKNAEKEWSKMCFYLNTAKKWWNQKSYNVSICIYDVYKISMFILGPVQTLVHSEFHEGYLRSQISKKKLIMVFPLWTRVERQASICMESYEHTRASPKSTFLRLSILYMCSVHILIQRLENMYTLCSIHLHILYDIRMLIAHGTTNLMYTKCGSLLLHATTAFLHKVSSF